MTTLGIDPVREAISLDLDGLIYFRGGAAARFPHDKCNELALEIASKLQAELATLPTFQDEGRLEQLAADYNTAVNRLTEQGIHIIPDPMGENVDEYYRQIGFWNHPSHVTNLIDDLCAVVLVSASRLLNEAREQAEQLNN